MLPGSYALTIYRGDTARWRFVFWADAQHSAPFDLTGATVKSEIRDKSGGAKIVPLTCTITLPNEVEVVLDAQASGLVPAKGVWDLQFTWPNGDVRTMVAGAVSVTADVTDSTQQQAQQRLRSA